MHNGGLEITSFRWGNARVIKLFLTWLPPWRWWVGVADFRPHGLPYTSYGFGIFAIGVWQVAAFALAMRVSPLRIEFAAMLG